VEHHVATYDHIVEIISSASGPFAILECICRKAAAMRGKPCAKTPRRETCMPIGDMARPPSRTARAGDQPGRSARDCPDDEADGLVFQPSNSQKVDFVCACCGCCCGMLSLHKKLPKPIEFWATNYQVAIDGGACNACAACLERCQVNALPSMMERALRSSISTAASDAATALSLARPRHGACRKEQQTVPRLTLKRCTTSSWRTRWGPSAR